MGRRRQDVPAGVEPQDAARIRRALDRLEERLMMAPPGLHHANPGTTVQACRAVELPPTAVMLWTRYDGLEIGAETARLLPVAQISSATEAAGDEGLLRTGDLVIGDHGRDLLVLPVDPYEEGADVVLIEEGGERLPEASTVAHLALGLVAEAGVMFDDDGEFRDELFGEDGELTAAAQRRLLRRRLDVDPDAPRARLRLAQHLWRGGEHRAALSEVRQVLRRAPELPWAYETMGRVHESNEDLAEATRAYRSAAEHMEPVDRRLAAYFRARAARCAEGETRVAIATQVMQARPEFAAEQVEAARALLSRDARGEAAEVIALGLAVSPGQVDLLALRSHLEVTSAQPVHPE